MGGLLKKFLAEIPEDVSTILQTYLEVLFKDILKESEKEYLIKFPEESM